MCPAMQQGSIGFFFDDVIDAVFVCLQLTGIAFQDLLRPFSSATLLVVKKHEVIQRVMIDPVVASVCTSFLVLIQHFKRRLICMQVWTLKNFFLQGLI
jgi:hypothetical protein